MCFKSFTAIDFDIFLTITVEIDDAKPKIVPYTASFILSCVTLFLLIMI